VRAAVARTKPQRGLVADFDGRDGRERAWVARVGGAPDECAAWLVVAGSTGRAAAPIAGTDPVTSSAFGFPSLHGAAPIDDAPGLEILVDVGAGASTTFLAVFTASGGELRKVDASGRGAPADDLFAYGGSVGRLSAVDCSGGLVVVSRADAGARNYRVVRRYYAPAGPEWRALPARTERGVAAPRSLGRRWPEFESSPFLSCET
jgi:hypothetical protein